MTTNKISCDKHEEFYIDHLNVCSAHQEPKEGCSMCGGPCPDCLSKLAKEWAGEFGWKRSDIEDLQPWDSSYWYTENHDGSREEKCNDITLVETVITPDGMLKAWEYAESRGYKGSLENDRFYFCNRKYGEKDFHVARPYYIYKYGKVIAIMLAALEAVKYEEGK